MSFSKLKGQPRAIALLKADIESDRLAESYLFLGLPQSGRRAMAIEFAKAVNCQGSLNKTDTCDDCLSCRKADGGNHPDIFVLDFDSQAKLLELDEDEARRQKDLRIASIRHLIHQSQMTPLEGRKRILIIDGAEFLSEDASNALLKSLEESTRSAHWILLATGVERVLPTVQSRCRRVSLASAGPETDNWDPAVNEILGYCNERETGFDPIGVSQAIFADKKKGAARPRADQVLKQLALGFSGELHKNPRMNYAYMLQHVFEAQNEVRRNVSPQLVMDSLLFSLKSSL